MTKILPSKCICTVAKMKVFIMLTGPFQNNVILCYVIVVSCVHSFNVATD